jgi:hypothetical protein
MKATNIGSVFQLAALGALLLLTAPVSYGQAVAAADAKAKPSTRSQRNS